MSVTVLNVDKCSPNSKVSQKNRECLNTLGTRKIVKQTRKKTLSLPTLKLRLLSNIVYIFSCHHGTNEKTSDICG